MSKAIYLYDTTLRDGTQRRGLSLTIDDKLKITKLLDQFGMSYVEGGWPASNPKDEEYFRRARSLPLKQAKITAFGSTRRVGIAAEDDINLQALVAAQTPAAAVVGKSWTLHVTEVLNTNLEENLRMIEESVRYLKQHGIEVIYDAEHFFDGYRADSQYAIATLNAAASAGADWIALCDTNGGSLPPWIGETVAEVKAKIKTPLGIHTHNDSELAVANALSAVKAGCYQVQGTINGYGERCGNANLLSIAANLQLKMGLNCVPEEQLRHLTELSLAVSEIANLNPDPHASYVGSAAFAHKGGIHAAAVEKVTSSYEHVSPETVGNKRRIVISELSGRGNIRVRAAELGFDLGGDEREVLNEIKELESEGWQLENADATFELILRRRSPQYQKPFELIDMMVVSERRSNYHMSVEAIVKLRVGEVISHTACEGDGPVHALDGALRKALSTTYPQLAQVRLIDYKVRILDPREATAATTRVLIEAGCQEDSWTTVGCSQNIIEASLQALCDSYEYFIMRHTAAVH